MVVDNELKNKIHNALDELGFVNMGSLEYEDTYNYTKGILSYTFNRNVIILHKGTETIGMYFHPELYNKLTLELRELRLNNIINKCNSDNSC